MKNKNTSVEAVNIYIELRKSRIYVGQLKYRTNIPSGGFIFSYDDKYIYDDKSIMLGPDLPLTQKMFTSEKLFTSFLDRIPSRNNSAYSDYCAAFNISVEENDPFLLLSTIGRKGPSAFIFEAVYNDIISNEDVKLFRDELTLSLRDFALIFDFSPYTIQKIESGKYSGKEIMKRINIYIKFPEVALFEIKRNSAKIHSGVLNNLLGVYSAKIMDRTM